MSGLERSLSLPLLIFYGLGTIVGAGIYVLIGKVAGVSGLYAPVSFLVAGVIAVFTAFSYAELSSRFPKSAAVVVYVQEAWQRRWLSCVVGWLVIATGIVSAATMANGFVGYIQLFFDVSRWEVIGGFVILLGVIAAWGIKESAVFIAGVTMLEIGGLFFVLFVGYQGVVVNEWDTLFVMPSARDLLPILLGSFLAFYAFIGFEDMVNVVEEVKQPRRTLPIAILVVMVCSTLIYVAVTLVAVRIMPIDQLVYSTAPLADIVRQGGYSPEMIAFIGLITVMNGVLVQLIMVSRVMYGMGKQDMVPAVFAHVNAVTQTPLVATLLAAVFILGFALWLPLVTLAQLTSFIMLVIFMMVNVALIRIKYYADDIVSNAKVCYPLWVPMCGSALCMVLILVQLLGWNVV